MNYRDGTRVSSKEPLFSSMIYLEAVWKKHPLLEKQCRSMESRQIFGVVPRHDQI